MSTKPIEAGSVNLCPLMGLLTMHHVPQVNLAPFQDLRLNLLWNGVEWDLPLPLPQTQAPASPPLNLQHSMEHWDATNSEAIYICIES